MSRKMATRLLVRCLLVLAVVWGTRLTSVAQTVNGSFHGIVSDSSGGAIPGATVVVKNAATGATRQATSDAAGSYAVTEIPPAGYHITVSKEGFRTLIQDVELLVAEDREANFSLPVGQVTQQIEVTAQAAALNTSNSTLGTVVGSTQVVDLPLNGRQFTQMILFTPGATPHEGGQQAAFQVSEGGGGISPAVNGQGARFNNFTLDGGLNNEVFKQTWTISPPPDAIEEFKVQSHSVDASVGMAPGANVNVATKTGTNHLHGDAWEFLRNDAFDAANFFDNFSHSSKPAYRQNQFGGTVGGPVMLPHYDGREKKTYFFGYYEGFRSTKGFTEFANVPYASELAGNFSDLLTTTQATSNGTGVVDPLGRPVYVGQIYNPYSTRQVGAGLVRDSFPGNIIPSNMINPTALLWIKSLWPAANYGPGGNHFPNYSGTSTDAVTGNQFGVRLDHSFGNNDTLFGAFYYNKAIEDQPCNLPGSCNILNAKGRILNIGYTHVFNPTLLLTLHYMHMYDDSSFLEGTPLGVGLLTQLNQLGYEPVRSNYPYINYGSIAPRFSTPNQFAVPLGPFHTHAINADLQKVYGKHNIGLGYLAYHLHSFDDGWGEQQNFDQFPTSAITGPGANAAQSGDGLASLLLNVPSSLFGFEGRTYADTTDLWQGMYAQDKWQASKKLTLTVGLRWDYIPPMRFKNNQDSGWSNNCGCLLITQPYGTQYPFANVRDRYFDPQWREFQPRFGFAYSATQKFVVRGGFAVFTDHGGNLIQETQDDRIAWPWGVGINVVNINRGVPTDFFDAPPPATSFFPSPTSTGIPAIFGGANERNKTPTSLQWNFGVEEQLSPSTTVTVDYVGSRDNHLVLNYTDNSPLPSKMGPGPIGPRSEFPYFPEEFAYDSNLGYSAYHALDVQMERRFSQGLTFLGSYTWSHCMDISSGLYDGDPLPNPYNLRSLWGRCDQDYPHILTFNSVYNLPFGRGRQFGGNWSGPANSVLGNWQVGGILSANSGAPFSVVLPFDNANTGTGGQFAEQFSSPLPSGFKQTQTAWYDPNAFGACAPYTYCDSGRNILRGPSRVDFDLSLSKDFKFTESKSLQLRFESFNIFNRVNFASPGGGAQGSFTNFGGAASVAAGTPNNMEIFAAGPAREIQFAAKLYF
jgi:hypothetical protein